MKRLSFLAVLALMLVACGNSDRMLCKRAAELCKYLPGNELNAQSREYMTRDFYAVLDTLFNMPEHEAMDHEWLHFFVTCNGGAITDFEVAGVTMTGADHAVADIRVRQQWEYGSFDETSDIEMHQIQMERVNGVWLMSDFDGHKADCIRHIAINRHEEAIRDAIRGYLVREIGPQYLQGEICLPVLMMVAENDSCLLGDFWVMWYNFAGDTLQTVSGGNHAGRMTIGYEDGKPMVTAFEQTVDGAGNTKSAKRIFGEYFDVYQNMHSNESVREAVRQEQLREYVRRHSINVRYYQDYGWPAVEL